MRGGEGNPSHDERDMRGELKANNSGTAYEIRRCEENTQKQEMGGRTGTAAILCRIYWDLGCRPGDSPIGWFWSPPSLVYILL